MNFDKFYNILYTIDSQFPGQHILLPKGLVIIEKLKYIMRCLYKQYNCVEISTASFGTCNIWDKTKHTEKYLENMFKISDKYYLKPMNCPMHIELMKSIYAKKCSLPICVFEFNYCFRKEKSGSTNHLFRLLRFTQDDSHIICNKLDIENYILNFIDMVNYIYCNLGIKNIKFRFSNVTDQYIGTQEEKEICEKIILEILNKKNIDFEISNDGAFYAPKIDILIQDNLNREWQTGTIQLDFCILKNLGFKMHNNEKIENYLVIHRAILGTFERILGILLSNDCIPKVLNPYKIAIIFFSNIKNNEVYKKIIYEINHHIFDDVDIYYTNFYDLKSIIKIIYQSKYNYCCIIGEKEIKSNHIVLQDLNNKINKIIKIEQLIHIIHDTKI
ncbi:threonyl-tRNA synthetase [uncultured bacterium]|nr:threonyl-tRNA synthetase [uncultured bacterium]